MGPTWGPTGTDKTQVGPVLAPWTLLSGLLHLTRNHWYDYSAMPQTELISVTKRDNCCFTATPNDRRDIWNYRSTECLFNSLFRLTTKKHQRSASLSLCQGNPPVTGGFPAQRDSNAENISIWWRHNMHWSICNRRTDSYSSGVYASWTAGSVKDKYDMQSTNG